MEMKSQLRKDREVSLIREGEGFKVSPRFRNLMEKEIKFGIHCLMLAYTKITGKELTDIFLRKHSENLIKDESGQMSHIKTAHKAFRPSGIARRCSEMVIRVSQS
ncbi:unnamed protein product [Dovyalis caffra]|uniref:Uncharacterized protein n=1 Tax=Dovyalis caffra TaxID=77055 RepID=A0AAV1R2W4_9ROSI|nr:unnamed protein product [Dovyalis caffra]